MLIIKGLNGQIEALTDVQGVEVNEEVNEAYTLSFTSLLTEKNKHSYPLLQEETTVDLNEVEFRIQRLNESMNRKNANGRHVFFDLNHHRVEGINGGTKTIEEAFSFILEGTGWTFENVDVTESALLPDFGNNNAIALIKEACKRFECEYKIMPNNHLQISKLIGPDTDEQFRYGHNVNVLKKSVSTDNMRTVIKGYGANGLEVIYRSPNADIYGERFAEPFEDEQYTEPESLLERLKQELNDTPEVSIDVELSQLDFNVELGMRLWLIYEPMSIDFKTRIVSIKHYPFSNRSPVVTISNKKKTLTDILTQTKIEIKKNQKETRSKIEQTNERIGLEVERIDESIATLEIKADNITLSVQSLDQRMGSAESTLSVQAGLISSKVSYGDVMSAIEQSPETIKLSANKIQLSGITEVSETLWIGRNNTQSGFRSIIIDSWSSINGHSDSMDLEIESSGTLYLNADIVLGTGPYGGSGNSIDFAGMTVLNMPTVPNADKLDGYQSWDFALAGHSHYEYTRDASGQGTSISLNSAGTLTVRLANGKVATFLPSTWSG